MKPVLVKDLLSFVVKSVAEIEHVMNVGNQNRSVGATNMNEHSSRSHAIFTIYIECSRKVKFSFFIQPTQNPFWAYFKNLTSTQPTQ